MVWCGLLGVTRVGLLFGLWVGCVVWRGVGAGCGAGRVRVVLRAYGVWLCVGFVVCVGLCRIFGRIGGVWGVIGVGVWW